MRRRQGFPLIGIAPNAEECFACPSRRSHFLQCPIARAPTGPEDNIRTLIEGAHKGGAKIGLCGEAPSSNPAFAAFLVECGIDSISVSPDSFIAVKRHVAEAEKRLGG